MSTQAADLQSTDRPAGRSRSRDAAIRLARYTALRLLALFATVVAGVYISILVANMGGYVDEIRRGQIREEVGILVLGNEQFRQLSPAGAGAQASPASPLAVDAERAAPAGGLRRALRNGGAGSRARRHSRARPGTHRAAGAVNVPRRTRRSAAGARVPRRR